MKTYIISKQGLLEWHDSNTNLCDKLGGIHYKIAAGKELPEHTLKGNEFTYVIDGSFSDKTCHYHEGDFVLTDTQTAHQPRASMDKDCTCFTVVEAPLKVTGFFGRMLNPFMR